MKHLRSNDPTRQERYEHEGRIYSIVDLTVPPDGHTTTVDQAEWFRDIMIRHYGLYKYELAEMPTSDNPNIKLIGRYPSFDKAKQAIDKLED